MSTKVLEPAAAQRAGRGVRTGGRYRTLLGYVALALLAYVPVLRSAPGQVAADTKTYLYLDPARLMGRALSMWDPNVGMGTVTHQTIGYLFPLGPFYWLFETLGLPDWVAQRLWLGTVMFAAGAGMLYLFRTFGMRGPGVVVGTLAYMLTPYSLDYAARISVLLLPWAALPWMIGIVRKALHDGGWRYPAIFAVVVQVVGGVNAPALIFAGVGPVLWVAYAAAAGLHPWRRVLGVTAKTGLLTVLASLWWIAGLSIQGSHGLNVLRFTETVETVARTSMPNEVLRGLGYWFFYGQDRLGPWIEASDNYTQRPLVIFAGYALAALALLAAALLRWRHRVFFIGLLLVGVVIAVGAHPYDDPTPLGAMFKLFANNKAGLALRSTARAVPLVALAIAVFLGVGVDAVHRTLRRADRPLLAAGSVALVVVLVAVNFPALVDRTYYGENLQRPEEIPSYWTDAARHLDAGDHGTRVLELPGADFASYRWGNTVDPITPGLIDRPYVARELIPYGSPASADLLNAVDRRVQEGVFDPRGFAVLARRMGVGDVVLRNDVQYERYDLVPTRELVRAFSAVPGLGRPTGFGPPAHPEPVRPYHDERSLASPAGEPAPHPVMVLPLDEPGSIVRAASRERPLLVAGDGEGLVDVADVGLLDGAGIVRYSASFRDADELRAALVPGTTLVVTDSNRKRARRWSSVLDNVGRTEQPDETPLRRDLGDARLDVFPLAGPDAFTTVAMRGAASVRATAYGNVITYTPEDRAARAFDGDPETAWRAGAFGPGIGQRIRLELDAPITADRVTLVQPVNGGRDRYITEVALRLDDDEVRVEIDGSSRTEAGQTVWFPARAVQVLEIEVTGTNVGPRRWHGGADAIGFAEIRLRDAATGEPVRVEEVVQMPRDLLAAAGTDSARHALVILMARERVVPMPPRTDPERAIVRALEMPTARSFALTGTARLTSEADHAAIAQVLGVRGPEQGGVATDAREFLQGCLQCRAAAAIDGDTTTAWRTPFVGVRRQWLEVVAPEQLTFDRMDLRVVADGRHSVPTRLRLEVDDAVRDLELPEVADGSDENASVVVPLEFAAVTGRRIRVTIVDVREQRTFSFTAAGSSLLPAGIAELGIPGLEPPAVPATVDAACRDDLLTIDGAPVPLRIRGASGTALAMGPLSVETCDPSDPTRRPAVELDAGAHEVRATPGAGTAIQLDRLVLASAAGGGELPVGDGRVTGLPDAPPAAPEVTVVAEGRTRMRVETRDAQEPFWLVLGQSHNDGWTARAAGRDLGPPQLVDGYANGWLVEPDGGVVEIVLDWTPQRRVWAGIMVALATVLGCLAVAVLTWRRARAVSTASARDAQATLRRPFDAGPPVAPWACAGAPVLAGLIAGIVSAPWIGLVVAVAVALALRFPAARAALAAAPAALVLVAVLYILYGQRRYEFDPIFEWPTLFPRARTLGWLAVVLVVGDGIVEIAQRLGTLRRWTSSRS